MRRRSASYKRLLVVKSSSPIIDVEYRVLSGSLAVGDAMPVFTQTLALLCLVSCVKETVTMTLLANGATRRITWALGDVAERVETRVPKPISRMRVGKRSNLKHFFMRPLLEGVVK